MTIPEEVSKPLCEFITKYFWFAVFVSVILFIFFSAVWIELEKNQSQVLLEKSFEIDSEYESLHRFD